MGSVMFRAGFLPELSSILTKVGLPRPLLSPIRPLLVKFTNTRQCA